MKISPVIVGLICLAAAVVASPLPVASAQQRQDPSAPPSPVPADTDARIAQLIDEVIRLREGQPYSSSQLRAQLGEFAQFGTAAVGPLVAVIDGDDETAAARRRAIAALGYLGANAEAAVPRLIDMLRDGDFADRFQIIETLGMIGPPAKMAVGPLIAALDDESNFIRYRAAEALGKIGPEARRAVGPISRRLKDTDLSVRKSAARALGQIGPDAASAIPALIEAVADARAGNHRLTVELRTAVIRAFGDIRCEADVVVPVLAEALTDDSAFVRIAAGFALREFGAEAISAIPALIEALSDTDGNVRGAVIEALGSMREHAQIALDDLQAIADDDPNQRIRRAAENAIKAIRGE